MTPDTPPAYLDEEVPADLGIPQPDQEPVADLDKDA